jgi:ParB-like chromosome segregation protein Spo0J
MNIETVQIDSIQLDPANVRRHPERNLATIKGSLARFGQQKPIVVDARGIIIAGNGTFEAARALGWTSIQIVRTALAGSEATAFAIADNRTSELAEWDGTALADVLAALNTEDATLAESAGFSPSDLAALLATTGSAEQPTPPNEFQSYDESIPTNCKCPRCGFEWSNGQ